MCTVDLQRAFIFGAFLFQTFSACALIHSGSELAARKAHCKSISLAGLFYLSDVPPRRTVGRRETHRNLERKITVRIQFENSPR